MPGVANREDKRDDRRSRRTRRGLSEALVALMLEKRYDTITVQEIIDRANVGRSTFYSHFQDKEDLLQSEVARLIATLVGHMDTGATGNRVIPSLELLRHVQESRELIRALVRGRAMEPVLKAMQTHLSAHVEARLRDRMEPGRKAELPLPVIANHVAGALMNMFQWWQEREMAEPADVVEGYFVELVRPSVFAATGVRI